MAVFRAGRASWLRSFCPSCPFGDFALDDARDADYVQDAPLFAVAAMPAPAIALLNPARIAAFALPTRKPSDPARLKAPFFLITRKLLQHQLLL